MLSTFKFNLAAEEDPLSLSWTERLESDSSLNKESTVFTTDWDFADKLWCETMRGETKAAEATVNRVSATVQELDRKENDAQSSPPLQT